MVQGCLAKKKTKVSQKKKQLLRFGLVACLFNIDCCLKKQSTIFRDIKYICSTSMVP